MRQRGGALLKLYFEVKVTHSHTASTGTPRTQTHNGSNKAHTADFHTNNSLNEFCCLCVMGAASQTLLLRHGQSERKAQKKGRGIQGKRADSLVINDSTSKPLTSSISLQTFHHPTHPKESNKLAKQKHRHFLSGFSLTAWLCICGILHFKALSDSSHHRWEDGK